MRWRIERYPDLGSTNELCRQRAAAGEPEGLVVIAERQTQGRGSFGRGWDSPAGNLYCSVLLRPKARLADSGRFSILSAVVIADAIAPLLPEPSLLALKWPNDLMLDGAKCAGILLDTAPDGAGGIASLVIGWGLNIATKPTLPDRPTACLADLIPPPDPADVTDRLLAALAARLATPESWLPAWLARGPAMGTVLRFSQAQETFDATFAGLADDGRLMLEVSGSIRTYASGEVRLVPPANE